MIKTLFLFAALYLGAGFPVAGANESIAQLPRNEKIWSTADQRWLTIHEWQHEAIENGDVLVIGEQHAVDGSLSEIVHHRNQVQLMELIAATHPVSLGMEFFDYPRQSFVDQYTSGTIAEAEFLRAIGWGGNAWPVYRDQVNLPAANGGRTWALNIPRTISGKVGRTGPGSLDEQEISKLPPVWEPGSAPYFERFKEVMNGHVPEERLQNFFWAQSLWDDTMAWQTSLRRDPAGVFVIIAGQFHVDFGHALPARLKVYGLPQVKTLVQAEVTEWNAESLAKAVAPDPKYGAQADYILVYELPPEPAATSKAEHL